MRQFKQLTVLKCIIFSVLLSFSINAHAEYYFVYEAPYAVDACGFYACAPVVCDPCGYSYYESYRVHRHYERSYAQMNEYAWIPTP